MPNSTFPAVVSFADNKKPVITSRFGNADDEDFSLRMEDAIEVQEIDPNLYMSKELWLPAGARGVFGGQIVAQALRAAFYTVPEDFDVHSLHSYFILAGSSTVPVIYQVRRLRDGRSYATRYVTASQNGKVIFVCSFSFAKPDTKNVSLTHQVKMPKVPSPDEFTLEKDSFKELLDQKDIAPKYREHLEERMEEISPVDYRTYADPKEPLTEVGCHLEDLLSLLSPPPFFFSTVTLRQEVNYDLIKDYMLVLLPTPLIMLLSTLL
ncbi:unnamed protein product [Rhizopus stolonifer]